MKRLDPAWVLAVSTGLVLALLAALRSRFFQVVFGPDAGYYPQICWNLAHGAGYHQTLLGHELSGLLEQSHFNPGLLLFAPLQWIWPGPESMAAVQGLLWGSMILPLHRIVHRATGHSLWGLAAGVFLALSPLGTRIALADFRPSIVAVVALVWMLERLQARRPGAAAVLAVLACSMREDVVLALACLGPLALWLMRGRRGGRDALWCVGMPVLIAALWSVLNATLRGSVSQFLEPGALRIAAPLVTALPNLQANLPAFLRPLPLTALLAPEALIPALPNLAGAFWLFASGQLLELAVNDGRIHYIAITVPCLALATALGAARVLRWTRLDRPRPRRWLFAALLVLTLASLPPHGPTSATPWLPAGIGPKLAVVPESLPLLVSEMRTLDSLVRPGEVVVADMHQAHLYADRYRVYWYNPARLPLYTRAWRNTAGSALLEPPHAEALLATGEGWVECWRNTRLVLLRRQTRPAEDPAEVCTPWR